MIYWSSSSIPEVAELSPEDGRSLWLRHYWLAFRTRFSPWAGLISVAALSQIGTAMGGSTGSIIGGAIGGFIFWQSIMESIHSSIKDEAYAKSPNK